MHAESLGGMKLLHQKICDLMVYWDASHLHSLRLDSFSPSSAVKHCHWSPAEQGISDNPLRWPNGLISCESLLPRVFCPTVHEIHITYRFVVICFPVLHKPNWYVDLRVLDVNIQHLPFKDPETSSYFTWFLLSVLHKQDSFTFRFHLI